MAFVLSIPVEFDVAESTTPGQTVPGYLLQIPVEFDVTDEVIVEPSGWVARVCTSPGVLGPALTVRLRGADGFVPLPGLVVA